MNLDPHQLEPPINAGLHGIRGPLLLEVLAETDGHKIIKNGEKIIYNNICAEAKLTQLRVEITGKVCVKENVLLGENFPGKKDEYSFFKK